MNKQVQVDGKVRTDPRFPAGFMDIVSLPKTGEHFRLMYDTKSRFVLHRLTEEEAKFKLCKVTGLRIGQKKIPMLTTHDGRTVRYPDPLIKVNDMVKIEIATGKIVDFIKFEVGRTVMITKGRNTGRVGVLTHRERHLGSFDIVHVKDSTGSVFATRLSAVFVIGDDKPVVTLPKGKGIKLNILEESALRAKKAANRKYLNAERKSVALFLMLLDIVCSPPPPLGAPIVCWFAVDGGW
jgi:small subunit ribosomal protein S4e